MDKAMYVDSGGAKGTMRRLEILTNNLANANTVGFRSDNEVMKTTSGQGKGQQSRAYSKVDKTYSDFKQGPLINTGRDLDVAIAKEGFIAVQNKNGQEAYTRAGNFMVSPDGRLINQEGDRVVGIGGTVNIPTAEKIVFAPDGTISVRLKGTPDLVDIDRLKLVNPKISDLKKGADGYFYLTGDGSIGLHDDKVRLIPGALEGSNVSAIEALTDLIDLSRNFEMHTRLIKSLEDNSNMSNQILQLSK